MSWSKTSRPSTTTRAVSSSLQFRRDTRGAEDAETKRERELLEKHGATWLGAIAPVLFRPRLLWDNFNEDPWAKHPMIDTADFGGVSDNYPSAIAADGAAVIGGQFRINGSVGMGAVPRVSGVTSAAALLMPAADGGYGGSRTLGALAGLGGMGLVVWLDLQARTVFESHRGAGGVWSAPRTIAVNNVAIPRFSKLTAARGLVHLDGTRIELNVDGYVGPATPSSAFSGITYGVEYAASHSTAAAIKTDRGADGGWGVTAAQCR